MPSSSRLTDMWVGICCCHEDPTCVPMGGWIITGSANTLSGSLLQGRLIDETIGFCGHPGIIVTGAPSTFSNGISEARIGEFVTGCNIGTVITGMPTHEIGSGSFVTGPVARVEHQGETFTYTEVDFGNADDEEDQDDGLNVFPLVIDRPPTSEEIARSAELDVSPTTTVNIDSTAAPSAVTPPVSCLTAPDPLPDDFQLSTNFTVGDLSIDTVLSKVRVRAQHGLTVQDITCNLQGWAENIGEPLSTQFGRDEMLLTSGFRATTGGTSQHERGQAVDLQYPQFPTVTTYNIAIWIRDNVDFDQLILEYGGNRPWIHVSFNRAGNRSSGASNKFGTRISPGNYVFGELRNMT